MNPNAEPVLQSIDKQILTPIVRQATGREALQIQDWSVTQLGGGAGNPVSVGLYRFAGIGLDEGAVPVSWSVVLKIIQSPANVGEEDMGEGEDPTHWNYWRRELLVYPSGLLGALPEGMAAPRWFGSGEVPGDLAWLWLEEISDSYGGAWDLERYALTARHLGQLNGLYSAPGALPAYPWLGNHLTRQWLPTPAFLQSIPWEHPRMLEHYPPPDANPFRRLLCEIERFLPGLARLPKGIVHGDAYPTNFMSRRLAGSQEQTVALDWGLMGVAPLGDDLGQLAYGVQMNLPSANREDLNNTLFESYMDGLRDCGSPADPQMVRFGFTASAALRVGLFQLHWLKSDIKEGRESGSGTIDLPLGPDCFEVAMANEAYRLLEII